MSDKVRLVHVSSVYVKLDLIMTGWV